MASLICIKLNYVRQPPYVSKKAADFAKAAVTTFDLYCIVLINNQMYVLREKKLIWAHIGLYKNLIVSMTTYHMF